MTLPRHPSPSDEPIRPIGLDAPASPPPPPPTGGGWGPALGLAATVVLVLLGALWFFTRPPAPAKPVAAEMPVEPETATTAAAPKPTPATAPGTPAPTPPPAPVDLARLEADKLAAEKAMEAWSILHGGLKDRGLTLWGGEAYGGALAKARQGDEALVRKTYLDAATRYQEATAALGELNSVTNLMFQQWIDDAELLAAQEDADGARARLEALAQWAPGSPAVAVVQATVERLLRIGSKMRSGEAHEKAGRRAQAFVDFQEAATLDPTHAGAAAALERVRTAMAEQEFRGWMTEGFAALARREFDPAEALFAKARGLRADSPEVRDALQQVAEGRRNARIELLRTQALAAEAAEDWDLAYRTHGEALNVDAGLVFARTGREQAQLRAQAVKRMAFFLGDPKTLQTARGLEEARALLAEARALTAGPKLAASVEALALAVEQASALIPVTLRSDGATRVAVFKHGQFDPFTEKSIELRPGTWTVTGIRPGYRDVRLSLVIAIGDGPRTLDVACTEKVR